MNHAFLKLYTKLHGLSFEEQGQDLVEYALLLTIISLALITSMEGIASAVASVFSNVSSTLV